MSSEMRWLRGVSYNVSIDINLVNRIHIGNQK